MLLIREGNIFTTQCQTIVNTVNCVGVMGAGIAYEFRLRHPDMFHKYQDFCEKKLIDIGKLWIYDVPNNQSTYNKILNFPTKKHWKYPSKIEYLEQGLQKFCDTYKSKNITSIAFPLLGADKGGLDKEVSFELMKMYLSNLDIDVEIWYFDPNAKDDLYDEFKACFLELDDKTIKEQSKLRIDFIHKVKEALQRDDINSLSGLLRVKGIGDTTLEKSFAFIKNYENMNRNLFNFEKH